MYKNKTKLIPFLIAIEVCFLLPEPVCPIEDDISVAVQLCMDLLSPLSAVQTVDCSTLHRLLLAPDGMKGFDLNELETLFKDIISAYRWLNDSSSSSILLLSPPSVRRDEVLKSEDVEELLECLEIYHNLGKFIHKKIVSVTSVRLPHQEDKQDQHVDIEVICPTPEEVSRNDDHEEEIEQRSSELVERLIGRQVGFDVKKETFLDPEDVRLLERGNPGAEPKPADPEPSLEVKKTVKHARTSFRTLEYPCRHCPFVADRYAVLQVRRTKWHLDY